MLKFFTDLAAALDALRRHATLFLLGVTIVALALLGRSWLDAHDASMRLQATLAAQQKTITDAGQRQTTRDAQLTQTLAQIASAEQKVQTPAQAAAALTQAIPQLVAGEPGGQTLPSPITIELPPAAIASRSSDAARNPAKESAAGNSPTPTNSATTKTNPRASDNTVATANISGGTSTSSASTNPNSSVKSSSATKYPWTSLKLELTRLGIGHATQSAMNQSATSEASGDSTAKTQLPAKKDLENREGSSASQKGSATANAAPSSASTQSTASASGNVATQSASDAKTNSLPTTGANEQGTVSLTQINSNAQSGADTQTGSSQTQMSVAPPAIIRVPQADLKPLYDAVEDCEVCQAKLSAAQSDLSDEKTKFAAATAQRDAAVSAARGTFWTRARTAAKWIVIGAAAGAVLARYH
jgi:hypothetical protein